MEENHYNKKSVPQELQFILLLEEMKRIERMTPVLGANRKENDAEHSWQIASMALFLKDRTKLNINIDKVIKMLLVHDIVEVFAGDTFAYDIKANEDKEERENESLKKVKEYLTYENAELLESLWREFDALETDDSKFANAMDRLAPLFLNIQTGNGGTWTDNNVKLSQVLKRAEPIKHLDDSIYEYIENEIFKACEKGFIIKD